MEENKLAFARLCQIMNDLREKCPWDQKQTIESLRPLTIEETYELGDVILKKDWKGIKEELGDILLHIVFYSKIAEEQQQFTTSEMIHAICEKLIYRHPHIYGNVQVKDENEVKKNWEQLKMREGKESVLGGVPNGLPAMIKAVRIQDKAGQVGFQWEKIEDVWDKVEEELEEFKKEVKEKNSLKSEEEFGDLLFALMNYARYLNIDPEAALERCNQKFISRFTHIEKTAKQKNLNLNEMTLDEMDQLWNEAKKLNVS